MNGNTAQMMAYKPISVMLLQSLSIKGYRILNQEKELPAVRRMQPITKKAKISSTTNVHCYNGYMVNNNNKYHRLDNNFNTLTFP